MNTFFSDIKNVLSDNCCIVGMGNFLKSDDAVGLYVVDSVRKAVSDDSYIFNVEDVIEAYVFKISELDCKNVVVIDAVKTDAEAGSIVFGSLEDEFDELVADFSTHKLALKMSGKIFKEHGKGTFLLGIVVNNVDFGAELSQTVRESADALIKIIIDTLNSKKGVGK